MKPRALKLFVLVAFTVCGIAAFLAPGSRAEQQQQNDPPVEKTRKNIQVLKGLPESQLFPLMNFIRTSLGVSCAYCHVNSGGDKWEWEKDDKPEKVIARKMMLMQFAINRDNRALFGPADSVTCYTCHRGQVRPLAVMTLPQASPTGGAAAEQPKRPAEPLPTAQQVVAKYEQAIGGRAAFEKLKSRLLKGTQTGSGDGTPLPLEIYQLAPNRIFAVVTPPQGSPIMTGYNGTMGWTKNQRGQRQLSGMQLEQLQRSAQFLRDFTLMETHPGLAVVGREKVNDREAYVLASQVADNRTERLYFDTETGLLLRVLTTTQTLLAPLPEQWDYDDYREVDGVKLPFTVRFSQVDPWTGWTRKFTEIKHNVPVEESRFNMPPAPAPARTPAK